MNKAKPAMSEARAALAVHPICGAYARTTGQACRSPAMQNGRCRMHGGRAGRPPKHGRYTKDAVNERRELRAALRLLRQLIDDAG